MMAMVVNIREEQEIEGCSQVEHNFGRQSALRDEARPNFLLYVMCETLNGGLLRLARKTS